MSLDSKQVQCWWAVGGKHRYNAIKKPAVKDRNEQVPVPFQCTCTVHLTESWNLLSLPEAGLAFWRKTNTET